MGRSPSPTRLAAFPSVEASSAAFTTTESEVLALLVHTKTKLLGNHPAGRRRQPQNTMSAHSASPGYLPRKAGNKPGYLREAKPIATTPVNAAA